MVLGDKFIKELQNVYGQDGSEEIIKAYNFADSKLKGLKRENGEDSIVHSFGVAEILINLKADVQTVICGLLHEVLDETSCSDKEVSDKFGVVVLKILQGLTKLSMIKKAYYQNPTESDNLKKMFLAMGSDARIAFVKLADRLDNLQTLYVKSKEKQVKIAKETMDLYAPIAERLGMNIFKRQIEDLCFKYLFPEDYIAVNSFLSEQYKRSESIVNEITDQIKKIAKEHNIEARIQSRKKSSFGVFVKWQKKGKKNVYDIIAHRIIVRSVQDCYTMLGAVHDKWKPMEGRIKDYIASPKENMYMSLHTTVIFASEDGEIPFEIQIRTEQMHNFCEYGIAAHWIYKESGVKSISSSKNAIRSSITKEGELSKVEDNAEQFLDNIKKGFYSGKIFVFTPNYNVVELPVGALPIDLAYCIHSNIGNKCVGAKVNGKMVNLTTQLETGDVVEIITSSASKGPSRDWLKKVKSREAMSKIRAYFKKEHREENIKIGKDILENYAKRYGFTLAKLFEDKETLNETMQRYKLSSIEEMYAVVGYGGLTSAQVLSKFVAKIKLNEKADKAQKYAKAAKHNNGVVIGGHSDLLKKFAKCCNPIPGDEIIGYVSRGKGVTIHRKSCPCIMALESDRLIETNWSKNSESSLYEASFKVVAKNVGGISSALSAKISESKTEICYILTEGSKLGEDIVLNVGIKISSRKQLMEVINKVRAMHNIYDVYR